MKLFKTLWKFNNQETRKSSSSSKETNSFFTDERDNSNYRTIQIGDQIWMAENLKYKFNKDSGFNQYHINENPEFGIYYDWESAIAACPKGWRIASDSDWKTLESFIGILDTELNLFDELRGGGDSVLKLMTDSEIEFNLVFSGFIDLELMGLYESNCHAYFWTSTSESEKYAIGRSLTYKYEGIKRFLSQKKGKIALSVRCVKE